MWKFGDIRRRLAARYKTGVVFIHTPKCGGSSVERALQNYYRYSNERIFPIQSRAAAGVFAETDDYAAMDAEAFQLRKRLMAYAMERGVKCLTGHTPYDPALKRRFADTHKFVTVLRDPVKRFCSNYRFGYRSGMAHQITEEIEDFVKTPKGVHFGRMYAAYYSGLDLREDLTSEEAIELAVKNLTSMDLVGFLDTMDDFQKQLRDTLGANLKIGHVNRTSDRATAWNGEFTPDQMRLIEEACAPDIEIFKRARQRLGV